MTDKEVIKALIKALESAAECVQMNYVPKDCGNDWDIEIAMGRAALAEQESEPEALFSVNDHGRWEETDDPNGTPLYTAPAVQPLTDEQISELDCVYLESNEYGSEWRVEGVKEFAHAVIAEFCRINGIGAPKE